MRRIFIAIALLIAPSLSFAAEITGLRAWQDPSRTSVVFDLSAPVRYELTTLRNPHRLVVDIIGIQFPKYLGLPVLEDSVVKGLRYARRDGNALRVVLDLRAASDVHDLLLPKADKYGDRLLLNFSRENSAPAPSTFVDAAPLPVSVPAVPPEPARISLQGTRELDAQIAAQSPQPELKTRGHAHALARLREPKLRDATPAKEPAIKQYEVDPVPETSKPNFMQKARRISRDAIGAAGDGVSWDVSGFYSAEIRGFIHDAQYPRQHEGNASFAFQPELYVEWENGRQSFLFVPFVRWDQGDPRRTHFDIREASYIKSARDWELRAGIRKVFWGVAESNHLIDVINQFDIVENLDQEDKLGQPMINFALIQDWGTLDLFALIGHRARTFPGRKGRLRTQPRVDTSNATYDSSAENTHIDWAARYTKTLGDFDIGLYHFWGTSRDPRFRPRLTTSNEFVLAPHYDLIHQTATDVQATKGNWLFKFEGLRRSGMGDTYYATVGGFEYTYVGIFDTVMDVGVLGEYHFDDRGDDALSPFNNDIFTGSRLAFNDVQDTAVLAGIFVDLDGRSKFFNVEASRRIGSSWKLEAEMRIFWDVEGSDPFFSIRRDDYVQLELARYF